MSKIPALAASLLLAASVHAEVIPAGPYLGQRPPGLKAEVFAPGIISLPDRREGGAAFSPDGRLCYFTLVAPDGSFATQEMHATESGWSAPVRAGFANEGNTGDAVITAGGTRLYFGSTRPPGTPPWNGRIWTAEREGNGWKEPRLLDLDLATAKGIGFPSESDAGLLYVGSYAEQSRHPNLGKSDIYVIDTHTSPLVPKNVGAPINSPHEEWDPFIAPDGSYLLFESDRPGGQGNIDIWVSFRASDGTWGEPVNLGADVNSPGVDVAARVSPDGRFLFFERPTRQEQDIYWVSAAVITRLKPASTMPPLVVTRASLWTSDGVQGDREILIRDGRVAALGASGELDRPANASVIDAAGDTLLPGLIDAHVHLVLGVRAPDNLPAATVTSATAKQLLRSGVTSGRIHLWDLPNAVQMQRDSAHADFPAPRLVVGGPALFGGRPEWKDPNANVWGVTSADDAVAKVRRLHEAGVNWIAVHSLTRFQPGELEALVAEVRRLGLGLMAGGDSLAEIERAVEVGVDSLEYLDRSDAPLYPDALVARIRDRQPGPILVPAIGFPHHFAAYRQGAWALDDPRITEFFPRDVATFIAAALREDRTKEIKWAPNDGTVPPPLRAKFRQLHTAGLPMVTGTDCGSPVHFQADAIWWELETMRQLGLSPDECLSAATVTAAQLLRQPDIGHLGVGAQGDFVLYRGSLASGPFAVDRVRAVAKGGVLYVDEGRWSRD